MTETVKVVKKRNRVKAFNERLHVHLPSYLKDQAQDVADELGVNLSDYIRDLLKADLATRGILASKIKQAA